MAISPSDDKPDVSVVMPVYNAENYLAEAIESVLAQEGVALELIAVDDGSTDESVRIFDRYRETVRVLRIPNSGGPSIPRNTGVAAARADFIAFLDADDVMLPGKLAAAVAALRGNQSVGLLCTDFQGIDGAGQLIRAHWLADYREFRQAGRATEAAGGLVLEAAEAFRQLLRANFVGTSSVVCRREALAAAGLFDPELKNSDDRDMWFRVARAGWDFLFLDRVYHSYRKSGGGVTARGGRRNPGVIQSLSRQISYVEDAADTRFLQHRLRDLWCGYGHWLRGEGDRRAALAAYRNALRIGPNLMGLRGWLLAWFGR